MDDGGGMHYQLDLFWSVAPRHQLDKSGAVNTTESTCVIREVHYHAYVVPVQKRLCKLRRLATRRCHFTGASKTTSAVDKEDEA